MEVPDIRRLLARPAHLERPKQRIPTVAAALALALTAIVLIISIADMVEFQAAYAQGATVLRAARISLIAIVALCLVLAAAAFIGRSIRGAYALVLALSVGNAIALIVAYVSAEPGIGNAARLLSLPGLAIGSAVLTAILYSRAHGRTDATRRFDDPAMDADGSQARGAGLPPVIAAACLGLLAVVSVANPPQNSMDDSMLPSGNEYYPGSEVALVADLCVHVNLSPVFEATTDEVEFATELKVDDEDLNQRCVVQSPGADGIAPFYVEVHLSYDATSTRRGGTCPWLTTDDGWGHYECPRADTGEAWLVYGHGSMLFECGVVASDDELRDDILTLLEKICMTAAKQLATDA